MQAGGSRSNGDGGDNNPQRRKRGRPVKWPDEKAYKKHRMKKQKEHRRQQAIDKQRRRLAERPVRLVHDSKTPTADNGQTLARMIRRNRLAEAHNVLVANAPSLVQPEQDAETIIVYGTVASADGGTDGGVLPIQDTDGGPAGGVDGGGDPVRKDEACWAAGVDSGPDAGGPTGPCSTLTPREAPKLTTSVLEGAPQHESQELATAEVEHYENCNHDNLRAHRHPASITVLGLKPQDVPGALTALHPGNWLTEDNIVAETTFWTRRASSAHPQLFTLARQYRKSCEAGAGNDNLLRLIAVFVGDLRVGEASSIFFPLNIEDNHWAAAVVFATDRTVQIFDSMTSCNGPRKEREWADDVTWLVDYLARLQGLVAPPAPWKPALTTPEGHQQQSDGNNCGIFMLFNGGVVATGMAVADIPRIDPVSRRRVLHGRLLTAARRSGVFTSQDDQLECLAYDAAEQEYCAKAGRTRPPIRKPHLHNWFLVDQPTPAPLECGQVVCGTAGRPSLPPQNLGGTESGSMDEGAPLCGPKEAKRDEGVVSGANDGKDDDAAVSRDAMDGEEVVSGADDGKDDISGVNSAEPSPCSTNSTSSVFASSASWAPPSSSSSTSRMSADTCARICGLASSSEYDGDGGAKEPEYDVLHTTSHAAAACSTSFPSPVPAAAEKCSGRKVRRAVRGATPVVHGRGIRRRRRTATLSFGDVHAAVQQQTVILSEDQLFLMELSSIAAPGAQVRGSLLAAAWLRRQAAYAAVVIKGPPQEYTRGQPDPRRRGVHVYEGMPRPRTSRLVLSSLSRVRTLNGPPRFQIPDYDNEKLGPKFRSMLSTTSGTSAFLTYRVYYYLFFDFPAFHVIDHVDGNTENNIYWNLEPVTTAENTLRGLRRVQKYAGEAVRCRRSADDPWTFFVNAECAVLGLCKQYPLLTVSQTHAAAIDGVKLCSLHWERHFGDLPGEEWSQYEDQELWLSNKGRFKTRRGGVALAPIAYNTPPRAAVSGRKLGYALQRTGGRTFIQTWETTFCHHFHGDPRAGEIVGFSSDRQLQLTPGTIHWTTKRHTRSPPMGPTNGHWVWTRQGDGPIVIWRSISETVRVLQVSRETVAAVCLSGEERYRLTGGLVEWRLLTGEVFVEASPDVLAAVRNLW